MPIRVLVADDHPIVREGLRSLLTRQPDLLWVGEAADGHTLFAAVQSHTPDIVLLDLRMPNGGGLGVLRRAAELAPATRWIVLSSYQDAEQVRAAIEAGAHGYLVKHRAQSEILDAIRAVARGERALSPDLLDSLFQVIAQQAETRIVRDSRLSAEDLRILTTLARGATTAEIGAHMHLSEVTVKRRIQEIVERLGLRNRTEAVAEAVRRGWIA